MQAFEGDKKLDLAITEWGPLFAIDPASPFFDHVKTLGSGVFAARTLNVFLRSPRVAAANFFKLTDLLNMGWIGRKPGGGFAATPALQVLRLYSSKLSGRLLMTDLSGPSFVSSSTDFIDGVDRAPVIDAVAARSSDGHVTVILSNANLTQDESVEIQIVGKFAGEIELLSGPAPDAHSGTGMISVPGLVFARPANFGTPRPANTDEITSRTMPVEVAGTLRLMVPACSVAAISLRPVP